MLTEKLCPPLFLLFSRKYLSFLSLIFLRIALSRASPAQSAPRSNERINTHPASSVPAGSALRQRCIWRRQEPGQSGSRMRTRWSCQTCSARFCMVSNPGMHKRNAFTDTGIINNKLCLKIIGCIYYKIILPDGSGEICAGGR